MWLKSHQKTERASSAYMENILELPVILKSLAEPSTCTCKESTYNIKTEGIMRGAFFFSDLGLHTQKIQIELIAVYWYLFFLMR